MKIYRNSYRRKADSEHVGYGYFSSLREARKAARARADLEVLTDSFDFPVTKKGIIAALSYLGDHPDNG